MISGIADFFQKDHMRLDRIFVAYEQQKLIDGNKAKALFAEFRTGLLRHIAWEEEILFPAFESKTGVKDSGPTVVMRFEHKQIKQHLENIQEYFSKNALPEACQEEVAIMHLLKMHNMKEEHALYPTIDRMTSVEEKSVIFEKIENKPLKSHSCCGIHHQE